MDENKQRNGGRAGAVGLFAPLLLIPMLVFTAMPNMFFGYESSGNEDVTNMTQQAMPLGGVYMSLDDFESTHVDSIITSIVAEYEDQGITIDEVKIDSVFDENDLTWLITINSASYQQNLNAMSAQDIRTFCTSRLTHNYSLLEGQKNVLTVTVRHLEPDKLMERMGFDEESRVWAGAIYEVLSGSNAIEEYAPYFEQYRSSYSGNPSGSGGEHGSGYSNDIDISRFVSPGTKNNKDLATVLSAKDGSLERDLAITERATREQINLKIKNGETASVVATLDALERKLGDLFPVVFKSITVDNGSEFADVEGMERSCLHKGKKRTTVYYCHPYCSSERGSNEKQNGMLRRRHPKGTDFKRVSKKKLRETTDWINNYPRKIFGFHTAAELFAAAFPGLPALY